MLYRKRRDRKIAVDYLGRRFEYQFRSELPNRGLLWEKVVITGYNPETSTITLKPLWKGAVGSIVWDTDRFWHGYRAGTIRDAV